MILFLTLIDSNENHQIYEGSEQPNYSYELLKCVSMWRRNAGDMKDCRIICFTNYDLDKFKNVPENLNIEFEKVARLTECVWDQIPGMGAVLAKQYPDEDILHIDLDMFLLRPFSIHMFNQSAYRALVAKYYNVCPRNTKFNEQLVSCFIYTPAGSTFYIDWAEAMMAYAYSGEKDRLEHSFMFEEHVLDLMKNSGYPLGVVRDLMYGDPYKHELDSDVVFAHTHDIAKVIELEREVLRGG